MAVAQNKSFDQVWQWDGSWWRPIYRKNDRCRIVKRSSRLNSILVEFEDGFRVITSVWAVRPITDGERQQLSFFGGD